MLRALFQTPDITPPPSEGAKTAVGCKERENTSRDTHTPAHNAPDVQGTERDASPTLERSCSTTTLQGGTTTGLHQPVDTPSPTFDDGSVEGKALCLTPSQRALAQRAVTVVGNVLKRVSHPGATTDLLAAMEAMLTASTTSDLSFSQLWAVVFFSHLRAQAQRAFLSAILRAFQAASDENDLISRLMPLFTADLLQTVLLPSSPPASPPSAASPASPDPVAALCHALSLTKDPAKVNPSEAVTALSDRCPPFYTEPREGTGAVCLTPWDSVVSTAPIGRDNAVTPGLQQLKSALTVSFKSKNAVTSWSKHRTTVFFILATVVASSALNYLVADTVVSACAIVAGLTTGYRRALRLLLDALVGSAFEYISVSSGRDLARTPPEGLIAEVLTQLDDALLPHVEDLDAAWQALCPTDRNVCGKTTNDSLSFEEYTALVVNLAVDLGKPFLDVKAKLLLATRHMQKEFPESPHPFNLTAALKQFTRPTELHAYRREFSDICSTPVFKATTALRARALPGSPPAPTGHTLLIGDSPRPALRQAYNIALLAKYFRDVFGPTELSAVAQLPAPKGPYGRCFICEDSFALTPTPYVEGSKSGPGDGRYFPHNSWRCKNILRSVSVLISRAAAKGIALVDTDVLHPLDTIDVHACKALVDASAVEA